MKSVEILNRFADAVMELLADEGFRYANPGEQAVTGRLSHLMVPRFPDWYVCAEWDRKAHEHKMLHFGFANQVAKLRAIRPDIIVHQIRNDNQNILVVEAKRIENRDDARDKAKLRAMTIAEGGLMAIRSACTWSSTLSMVRSPLARFLLPGTAAMN